MIIGNNSKQGVRIGEYAENVGKDDLNAVVGWIEPACERPRWIAWFTKKGDLMLYTQREANGAVVGDPIKIPAV